MGAMTQVFWSKVSVTDFIFQNKVTQFMNILSPEHQHADGFKQRIKVTFNHTGMVLTVDAW